MINWFKKAQEVSLPDEPNEVDKNDMIQGSYTDHELHPFTKRMQLDPMNADEFEAFSWVIKTLQTDQESQSEVITKAFDMGYFEYGKEGELRVAKSLPQ